MTLFNEMTKEEQKEFMARIDCFAKMRSFCEALGEIVPIDWTVVACKMRANHCSDEAIAFGLYLCRASDHAFLPVPISQELDRLQKGVRHV